MERERLAYTSNNALLLTSGSSWMEQGNETTTSKRFPGAHSWMSVQRSGSTHSARSWQSYRNSTTQHGMADASCRGIHARMAPLPDVERGRGTTQLLARLLQWAQASSLGSLLALFERWRARGRITRELTESSYIHVVCTCKKATWSAVVPLHGSGGAGPILP